MNYKHLILYLKQLYPDRLYERDGITYPAVVHHAKPSMQIDDVLGRFEPEFISRDNFAFYDYGYLHNLQNRHKSLYNGVTFVMERLRTNSLKMDVRLGYYFDMLATCGALNNELEVASERRSFRLLGRAQFHRQHDAITALTSGAGLSVAIGVAVLVVFKHEGVYKAIMARRGADNATDSGRYHLLPAFIFQPQREDVQVHEWSLEYHVWREYLEELFGMEEHSDAWREHPAYHDIQERIAKGQASLHFTGIATNVMTLRPEVCGLLLIDDEGWYERITATSSDMPFDAPEAKDGMIEYVTINTDETIKRTLPSDLHEKMPPQGLIAFWLGVDRARQVWQG